LPANNPKAKGVNLFNKLFSLLFSGLINSLELGENSFPI
jgi:hypothetical protein